MGELHLDREVSNPRRRYKRKKNSGLFIQDTGSRSPTYTSGAAFEGCYSYSNKGNTMECIWSAKTRMALQILQ